MQSRYGGWCSVCGSSIAVADDISPYRQSWVHARCVPDGGAPSGTDYRQRIDRAKPRVGEVVCSDCFLIHPAGACDR